MTEPIAEVSLRRTARLAGVFYLLTFLTGAPGGIVIQRVVVLTDGAATAANLRAYESLYWLAFASTLIQLACYVIVTMLLFELLKQVNRTVSVLAVLFSLLGLAVLAVSTIFYVAPMVVLTGAFEPAGSLILLFFRLQTESFNIGCVFFGFYCILIGWLIARSGFLPRILGYLMVLSGLGWLTFLVPPVAAALQPLNFAAGAIGEAALTLWLLVAGVNVDRASAQSRTLAVPSK